MMRRKFSREFKIEAVRLVTDRAVAGSRGGKDPHAYYVSYITTA